MREVLTRGTCAVRSHAGVRALPEGNRTAVSSQVVVEFSRYDVARLSSFATIETAPFLRCVRIGQRVPPRIEVRCAAPLPEPEEEGVSSVTAILVVLTIAAFLTFDWLRSRRRAVRLHVSRPSFADAIGPEAFARSEGLFYGSGHTWARLESDGLVSIGADDFAHKLVGSAKVGLPALGERIAQGEPAFQIGDGEKDVPMLAPVDGTVVAVNQAVKERQDGLDDPYGRGWLFKVKAPRLAANLRQLLEGGAARRFMEEAEGRIAMQLAPELGQVLQDGGTPVHGISRALAGDKWDDLARQFFLT